MPPGTTAAPEVTEIGQGELIPLYHVVLLDDDQHTYDYVMEMLGTLFLMKKEEAFRKAVEVDTTGRTILITCELPQAEFARDQVHSYGADWRMPNCQGSMTAVLEPAGGNRKA
jgi:ATP-dependent Clp protease adaptor protein ClpS